MYAASPVLHCEIPILLNRREKVHMRGQGDEEGYQGQHWLVWKEAAGPLYGPLTASEPEPAHEGQTEETFLESLYIVRGLFRCQRKLPCLIATVPRELSTGVCCCLSLLETFLE